MKKKRRGTENNNPGKKKTKPENPLKQRKKNKRYNMIRGEREH